MKIRNGFIERLLAVAAVGALHLLFLTIRKRFHLVEPEVSPYRQPGKKTFTFFVWHDSLIMPLFVGRQPATMALVGMHRDGSFLAHALQALGLPMARGSSSRGGAQAIRHLIESAEGHHIVVTPDGPRGPRREAKSGCVYIASRTSKPIVPTAFVCSRSWSIGTGWTDLVIPKPFSTVHVLTAPAIDVPCDAPRAEMAKYCERVQESMTELNERAARMVEPKTLPLPAQPSAEEEQNARLAG